MTRKSLQEPFRVTVVAVGDHVVRSCSTWSITSAAAAMAPILHGHELTLRSALKVILIRKFPRSPTARFPLWALLWVFCSSVSSPPLGFLNATAMVSDPPRGVVG